jgi:hypothetical protein
MAVKTTIKFRRDTEANWAGKTLADGELGYVNSGTNKGKFKIGDGTTVWGSLPFAPAGNADTATSATSASTANNINSGAAGQVVYQSGASTTGFTAVGVSGQVLTSAGTGAPTWTSQSGLTVGSAVIATTATNIGSGSAGAIVYQSSANTTGFSAAGSAGQVLTSNGTGAPLWVNQATLVVGSAGSASTASVATTSTKIRTYDGTDRTVYVGSQPSTAVNGDIWIQV